MSLEHNGEVFVTDLVSPNAINQSGVFELLEQGADKIWRLVNDGAPGKFKVHGQIDVAPGNGPRHMAIRGMCHLFSNDSKTLMTLCRSRQYIVHGQREDFYVDRTANPGWPQWHDVPSPRECFNCATGCELQRLLRRR